YLKVTLGDRTGTVQGVMWEGLETLPPGCDTGSVVRVGGQYSVHSRYGPQLTITAMRAAHPSEADLDQLLDGPPRSAAQMEDDLPGFPARTAAAVLHIILSHHGTLEHGSPVVPCTREATLVHMIDNLGGRLGSFDRIEKELPEGAQWSAFDRALGGGAWFAGR